MNNMGNKLEEYKAAILMFGLQFANAGVSLSSRAALLQGMNSSVFVVYRQTIAFMVIAPIAYFSSRRNTSSCRMGCKSFCLIFMASFVGVTMSYNIYFVGLYMASASMASAMSNLVPALTFLMAAIFGLEKVKIRSMRSIAKIMGTVVCVSGAFAMALVKGANVLPTRQNWLIGCLLLFGNSCCWSFRLLIQVPISKIYPDHLSLSAWLCLMSTIQSAAFTLFYVRDLQAWHLQSYLQLGTCLYSGVFGSAAAFFIEAWCISKRGPLFSAMFNPLNTVITTFFASVFLHEQINVGSVVGALGVIIGVYIVLWGKAEDHEDMKRITIVEETTNTNPCLENSSCNIDLNEPLLSIN